MSSLTEFFDIQPNEKLKGITHKNNIIKRNIIAYMAVNGECTLAELTKELHISVPTITKLVQELIEENIVNDLECKPDILRVGNNCFNSLVVTGKFRCMAAKSHRSLNQSTGFFENHFHVFVFSHIEPFFKAHVQSLTFTYFYACVSPSS